jgi:hypothetical protein
VNDPTAWADGVAQIVRDYLEDQVGELRAQHATVSASVPELKREMVMATDELRGLTNRLDQRLEKLEASEPLAQLADYIARELSHA